MLRFLERHGIASVLVPHLAIDYSLRGSSFHTLECTCIAQCVFRRIIQLSKICHYTCSVLYFDAASDPFHASPSSKLFSLHVSMRLQAMIQTDNMVPAWARPENYLRDAPASDAVHIQLDLGFRNHDEVQTFSAAVSDPSSPLYRQYLSPDDFNSKFAPTARQSARVANWLRRQGLQVVHIPSNNKYVAAEGDVAAMNRVFATKLALYNGPRGLTLRAPSIAPSLPKFILDSATRVVIHGLDQHTHALKPSAAKRWATEDSIDLQSNRRHLLTKTPTPHPNGCIWNSTTTSVPPLLTPGLEGCHYTTNQVGGVILSFIFLYLFSHPLCSLHDDDLHDFLFTTNCDVRILLFFLVAEKMKP